MLHHPVHTDMPFSLDTQQGGGASRELGQFLLELEQWQ